MRASSHRLRRLGQYRQRRRPNRHPIRALILILRSGGHKQEVLRSGGIALDGRPPDWRVWKPWIIPTDDLHFVENDLADALRKGPRVHRGYTCLREMIGELSELGGAGLELLLGQDERIDHGFRLSEPGDNIGKHRCDR